MKNLLIIAFGGSLGSILRYLTTLFVNKYINSSFPYATFLTNCLGCFMIGLFFGYLEKNNALSQDLKLFLITGFCGGYTTFSAFSSFFTHPVTQRACRAHKVVELRCSFVCQIAVAGARSSMYCNTSVDFNREASEELALVKRSPSIDVEASDSSCCVR